MKTRLLSVLSVFLLLASVSIPAVTAEQCSSQAYYELHDMCLCNAKEDLGHIPFLNWGIGYSAHVIDSQSDKWEIFVRAGSATKNIIITPQTDGRTLATLRDFTRAVKECKNESDQIPADTRDSLLYGVGGSIGVVGGALYDNAQAAALGLVGLGYSTTKIAEITAHFNKAKGAQQNAEKLFEEL